MKKRLTLIVSAVMLFCMTATAYAMETSEANCLDTVTVEETANTENQDSTKNLYNDEENSNSEKSIVNVAEEQGQQSGDEELSEEENRSDAVTSGSCGANVNWSFSGDTLTLTGSGSMYDFPVYNVPGSSQCMPWYYLTSSIRNINIGEGITTIGSCAFWGCTNLTSVTTPNSLKSIGFGAFANCTGLQSVTIQAGKVGESAFINCTGLKTVGIGASVTDMGISAFENCTALQGVYISDLAAWCKIYFGGIKANPLEHAKHLYLNGSLVTNLSIPAGVTSIGDFAFHYCTDITSVSVPSSVKSIGNYAFYMCTSMKTLTLNEGLTSIGASAFDSCVNLFGTLNIPSTVTSIGHSAFRSAPYQTVIIPNAKIAPYAFYGCGNIVNLTIGDGVPKIGKSAFENCRGIYTLTLGNSVGTIADNAFNNAGIHDDLTSIHSVTYTGTQTQYNTIDMGANNNGLTNADIHYQGSGRGKPSGYSPREISFTYGTYGGQPIEWILLKRDGNKALVISKYVLSFERYCPNIQASDNTWKNSTIRSWLNNSFLNDAFNTEQQSHIITTSVSTENNSRYGTSGGNTISDKLFLLSAEEVAAYFPDPSDAMTGCTDYAISKYHSVYGGSDSALKNPTLGTSYWWLRNSGEFTYDSMYVDYYGSARDDGAAVANTIFGIRPAMWVDSAIAPESKTVYDFVSRLYLVCLSRNPDTEELDYWVNRLNRKEISGIEAAYGFVFSQEFRNKNLCNNDYVKKLYLAFMGRDADEDGLKYWVDRLKGGATREEVFNGFAQSSEFKKLCTEYGITAGDAIPIPQYGTVPMGKCTVCGEIDGVTAFVTGFYKVCLNRTPDDKGLQDWTNALWNHTKSGSSVGLGFVFSQEFIDRKLSDEDFVEVLYNAFFGRPSDAGGKTAWVKDLKNGKSRLDVFNGFVGSTEFDTLCKSYGIVRE